LRTIKNSSRLTVRDRVVFFSTGSHYDVLGVSKSSSQSEIKAKYIELARRWHPDVSREANADSRFQEISAAYDVLGDPIKRGAYDSRELYNSQIYNASRPYSSPYAPPRSRPKASAFVVLNRLSQGSAIAYFGFLMPIVGLLFLCLGTLKDTSGVAGADVMVPMCWNRKTGRWEEYTFHSMHRHQESEVRYVRRSEVESMLNKTYTQPKKNETHATRHGRGVGNVVINYTRKGMIARKKVRSESSGP